MTSTTVHLVRDALSNTPSLTLDRLEADVLRRRRWAQRSARRREARALAAFSTPRVAADEWARLHARIDTGDQR